MIDNAFSSVSISKSGQTLLVVVRRRTHRGNHNSLTITTEVILWAESDGTVTIYSNTRCNVLLPSEAMSRWSHDMEQMKSSLSSLLTAVINKISG